MSTRDTDIAQLPGLFDTPPGENAGQIGQGRSESGPGSWDAEAALRALFDSVHSGILIFGPGGEMRAMNNHFAEMLGYEKSELLGLSAFGDVVAALCQGFVDPELTASRWRERYEAAMPCWDEVECISPNRKHLERFGRPIVATDGSRSGWLEVYGDVTGQKLMEGKLFQIERMVTLGQLVAGVAHELSNPLTSILGYAQLLRRRIHTYQGEEDVERILQEAERASSIAKSLLQFGRGGKPERGPVMLNDVVRSVLKLRAGELAQEQIEVRLELAPDLPPVSGDRGQLQQVLLNLLVNSEQAIGHRSFGGSIRIFTRRTAGDRLAIDIIDNGPGIPPEALPHIFDPFFTTKPAGVGTGLGLSIAYGITHDHGGSIAADSRPGCGAAFTVELPVSAAPPLAARSVETWKDAQTAGAVRPLDVPARSERILVIEDEPAVARLIADVLSEEGHRADVALDSRKGMSLIARKRYGLVLCDLRMPHVSGRSLFENLQKRRHPLCRRFVFVTGDALSPGVLQFLENTGVPFLAKPFLVEELKEVVRRALERRDALVPWSASRSKSLMSRSNPERQRVAR